MLGESISIFEMPRDEYVQSLSGVGWMRAVFERHFIPQWCLYVLPLEIHWTYDLARSVNRGDNPNKKILMNEPNSAHGHNPVAPAGKSIW